MPMYDYVCPKGHAFDSLERFNVESIPCAVCRGKELNGRYSEVSWSVVESIRWELSVMYSMNPPYVLMAWKTQLSMPSWKVRNANPLKMTVHRDPQTGEYRFPGHRDAPMPSGMERIDIDTAQQARKIEKVVCEREEAKGREAKYREQDHFDRMRRDGEADIRAQMGDFSQAGRAFAEQAMLRNRKIEADRTPKFTTDVGFDVLSNDRSNRESHADEETGWKTQRKV